MNIADIEKMITKSKTKYVAEDIAFFKSFNHLQQFNNGKLDIPFQKMYDASGNSVLLDNISDCGTLISFLQNKDVGDHSVNVSDTLESFLETLVLVRPDQNLKNFDYVIFVTFAEFAHRLSNKENFDYYKRIVKGFPNVKIFLLNLDLQETWKMSDALKTKLGV